MKLWSTELSLHNGNGNSIPFLRPASSLHCNETLLILVYFLSFSRFFFVQNMESGHQRPFKFVLDIAWTSVSAQMELSASETNIAWTSVSSILEDGAFSNWDRWEFKLLAHSSNPPTKRILCSLVSHVNCTCPRQPSKPKASYRVSSAFCMGIWDPQSQLWSYIVE